MMLCPAEAERHHDARQNWLRKFAPPWLNLRGGWNGPMLVASPQPVLSPPCVFL